MRPAENFSETFAIAGRRIGAGESTYVIAEAGVAHFGDPGKALALVDLAADGGADAFKTQAFTTDALISARLPEWRDRLRPKEVGFDFIARMKQRCDQRGITFLCTAHDPSVLPWLDELEVPAYKIGSGERGNTPFLRELARRGKPMILSTGMYEERHLAEVLAAIAGEGLEELALLHCVTSYPTPLEQVNLRAMDRMRELFAGPVGYSDHTQGHQVVLAAVARGASIVEKHITLDFNVPNAQDWKVSCGPDDFAAFVREIREVETALGRPVKEVQPCEQAALDWALKSLVAARDLPAGTVLEPGHLLSKRPGDGLPPSRQDELLDKRLARPVAKDTALRLEDLEP
jgi:N,N'-diacetyllegionaminate synthase